jgi:hypothetical protein
MRKDDVVVARQRRPIGRTDVAVSADRGSRPSADGLTRTPDRHFGGSEKEVNRMSWKPSKKFAWRPMLFSLATLATIALAAGARYKP